jgi:hypothetical protein
MKHEYHEGAKAGENFEQLARAAFQTPKVVGCPILATFLFLSPGWDRSNSRGEQRSSAPPSNVQWVHDA